MHMRMRRFFVPINGGIELGGNMKFNREQLQSAINRVAKDWDMLPGLRLQA